MTSFLALADLAGYTAEQVSGHIESSYEAPNALVSKFDILIAYESVGSWGCDSASWFLLREKETGSLYENHGSRCSCYGFEGQFEPERTSIEALLHRPSLFYGGGYDDDVEANRLAAKEFVTALTVEA
jgi:hypothetical protein